MGNSAEGKRSRRTQVLDPLISPSVHLHLLISKEKEDEEARSSLQGQMGPPGLGLPAPTVQGVADDVRLGGVEARVEVDGDIWPGVQAAATLEVHLEPRGDEALKGHLRSEAPGDPEGREGVLWRTPLTCVHLQGPLPGA